MAVYRRHYKFQIFWLVQNKDVKGPLCNEFQALKFFGLKLTVYAPQESNLSLSRGGQMYTLLWQYFSVWYLQIKLSYAW